MPVTVRAEAGGLCPSGTIWRASRRVGSEAGEGKEAQHPYEGLREAGLPKFQTRVVAYSAEKKPEEKLETQEA